MIIGRVAAIIIISIDYSLHVLSGWINGSPFSRVLALKGLCSRSATNVPASSKGSKE